MKTHLVLLRGINVSGQKLIKLEELRGLLTEAGFANVATYIQSGNVFVDSDESSKLKIAGSVKAIIREKYGFDVGILVLNLANLKKTVNNNLFVKEKNVDLKKIYVAFLSESPAAAHLEKFRQFDIGEDVAVSDGDVMYLKYAAGAGKSKLSNAAIENKLKVVSTVRNWNTTLRLLEMFSQRS